MIDLPFAGARLDLRSAVLRSVSGRQRGSRIFTAAPEQTRFEVWVLGFLLTMLFIVCVIWYFELSKPVGCQTSPLYFRLGSEAEATMTMRANARCPVYVHTGSATIDEPLAVVDPAHGVLVPRGHSGVYYRPERNFTGQDYFAIVLNGKSGTQSGAMTVRVNVLVQ
jgi:hypothetical protein